jgi:hypothetical protein
LFEKGLDPDYPYSIGPRDLDPHGYFRLDPNPDETYADLKHCP